MKNNPRHPGKKALDARMAWLFDRDDALMRDECARLARPDHAHRCWEHPVAA